MSSSAASPDDVARIEKRARTMADVRLEVAVARNRDPRHLALELKLARQRLEAARQALATEALTFSRLVDRVAGATSEAFVFETLELDENGILELVRAQTPSLMELR